MKKGIDSHAVRVRLRRVEGQIRGIIKMVDEGQHCEDILIQVGSAKSALHKIGQIVLEGHLQYCVMEGIRKGRGAETVKKLYSALEQFSRII